MGVLPYSYFVFDFEGRGSVLPFFSRIILLSLLKSKYTVWN